MLKQTFSHWELVIVDDGSTDNKKDVVERFDDQRIRNFKMDRNRGAPFCRNFGIRQTRYEYVGLLDSDDLFHPDRLSKHWDLMATDLYDATVSACERHSHSRGKVYTLSNILPKENLIVEFITKAVAWRMYPIWRKRFLIEGDIWFCEELKNSQDYQFNCFAILNRPAVGYIHESLGTKNENTSSDDPFKIRKSNSFMSLTNHLISRALVLRYAASKGVNEGDLLAIRQYVWRHRVSCLGSAFRLSFMMFFRLLFFSFSLSRILRGYAYPKIT
jgi:glycosyltransferase involved in cell wall biosynthesis